MEDRIEMSAKEVVRLEVLRQVVDGQAGQRLGLTERQVRCLLQWYEDEGVVGLVSRRRGRPSNRRINEAVRTAVLTSLRSEAWQAEDTTPT